MGKGHHHSPQGRRSRGLDDDTDPGTFLPEGRQGEYDVSIGCGFLLGGLGCPPRSDVRHSASSMSLCLQAFARFQQILLPRRNLSTIIYHVGNMWAAGESRQVT